MSVLDDILVDVRADLAERQARVSLDDLKARAEGRPDCRNPLPLLRGDGVAVIAEVKRSSPSQGRARRDRRPGRAGRRLRGRRAPRSSACSPSGAGSAAASTTSVAVRAPSTSRSCARTSSSSSYQLWEARAHGADLVLLIVAALEQNALVSPGRAGPLARPHRRSSSATRSTRWAARSTPAPDVIGVNARDLRTLEVDREIFAELAPHIPGHVVRIAESGVRGPHDVIEYARAGADAVLVGESLVTGRDPRSAVADLVAAGAHPALKHDR